MRIGSVAGISLCAALFTVTTVRAHSEQAISEAFPRGPVPPELIEATREFESTAGMNSLRAEAHAKQHRLLQQYLKAGWQRICDESRAALPRVDEAILVARDSANVEEESQLRRKRDEMALIIAETCAETSSSPSQP